MNKVYCAVCGPPARPVWIIEYSHKVFVKLLCKACCFYASDKMLLITYDDFMNDQWLVEIVCKNIKNIFYIDEHNKPLSIRLI